MSAAAARLRYLTDQVNTASPAALIVLLYDRLSLDIDVAVAGQAEGDVVAAATALAHGQRIVTELLTSLDIADWSGGEDLAALYRYLLLGLIDARTTTDPRHLAQLGKIVADLRSAWHGAAVQLASGAAEKSADAAIARVG